MHLNVFVKKSIEFLRHTWVKYTAGILLLGLILYEIKHRGTALSSGNNILELVRLLKAEQLVFITLLVVTNWGLEILKWHFLISKIHSVTFWQSCRSVLIGLSWGIFTPHRIGEYGGRIVLLPAEKRLMGGALNFVSSLSQNLIHLILGLIGFGMIGQGFVQHFSEGFFGFMILLVLALLWMYFNINRMGKALLKQIKYGSIIGRWLPEQPISVGYMESLTVLGLSFLRYLCYMGLFAYLIIIQAPQFYGVGLLFHIAIIFLLQSGIPLPAGLAVLARIEISILILSNLGVNVNVIILSSVLLWILNIGIPSLFGAVFLLPGRKNTINIPN